MSEFEKALELTIEALQKMRRNGTPARGSREALARLIAAREVVQLKSAPQAATQTAQGAPPREAKEAQAASRLEKPVSAPGLSVFPAAGASAERMNQLKEAVAACVKCPQLARTRTQTVFGTGNIEARIMFVGEAPGADEDLQGEPFVGKAGQLLTKIIEATGLKRGDVYIANVLKCRPDMPPGSSGNRRPTTLEMETCLPYLRAQIEAVRPAVLVALGSVAMEGLLGAVEPMARLRGKWHEFQGIPLMATYHPAYLLRNQAPSEKRKVWEDIMMVMEKAGLPISEKQRGFFLK